MTSRAFLVTGTDTGVGKTTVTCSMAAALADRRMKVGVSKPVETGCEPDAAGVLQPADALRLQFFSGCSDPLDQICPIRFRAPLAPSEAARREGTSIDLQALGARVRDTIARHDVTFVEGAGGLLVPVHGRTTFADLARDWNLPLLVVVANKLGALNHAQLTIGHARAAGLAVAGYILNPLAPEPDVAMETNGRVLSELIGPSLGTLPWLGSINCEVVERTRLARAAEGALALTPLTATG